MSRRYVPASTTRRRLEQQDARFAHPRETFEEMDARIAAEMKREAEDARKDHDEHLPRRR